MNAAIVPIVVVVTTLAFVVVPILNTPDRGVWSAWNITLTATREDRMAFAPLDSKFHHGMLVGPNGTVGNHAANGLQVCAGAVPGAFAHWLLRIAEVKTKTG